MVVIKKTFYFLALCVGLVILSQTDFQDTWNTARSSEHSEQITPKTDTNDLESLAWLKK